MILEGGYVWWITVLTKFKCSRQLKSTTFQFFLFLLRVFFLLSFHTLLSANSKSKKIPRVCFLSFVCFFFFFFVCVFFSILFFVLKPTLCASQKKIFNEKYIFKIFLFSFLLGKLLPNKNRFDVYSSFSFFYRQRKHSCF